MSYVVRSIRAEASRLATLTGKAKKLGAALFSMAGLYQVEPVRAVVMPQLIRHPHISSIVGFFFAVWLLLHNPILHAGRSPRPEQEYPS